MDAPDIGPAKMASSPTVAPMAMAAAWPTTRTSVATAMMTNIRMNESTPSSASDWTSLPDGSVAPIVPTTLRHE